MAPEPPAEHAAQLPRNTQMHSGADPSIPAEVTVFESGVWVWVWVWMCDHDPGIEPEDQDRVFERFRAGVEAASHVLGLPPARRIARARGGDRRLDPSISDGADFTLTLC